MHTADRQREEEEEEARVRAMLVEIVDDAFERAIGELMIRMEEKLDTLLEGVSALLEAMAQEGESDPGEDFDGNALRPDRDEREEL